MPLEDDFLVRTMRRLLDAITRVRSLRDAGALDEAQRAADDAYNALGVGRATLGRLDAPSIALVLGSTEKVEAMARLLEEESRLAGARGDASAATRAAAVSRALHAEVARAAEAERGR